MEPIAITGIGCKLPGGVVSPSALWEKLLAGADLVTDTPPDRWNVDALFCPDRAAPGRTYSRWGGYVSDPAGFDAGFFGLTPREAVLMDPQQRWLLEVAWEAIQDAGYPLAALAGTDAGVYVGVSSSDYGDIQKRGRYDADVHTSTGQALSITANRVSYLFDLRGPSLAVDTACSSSLVALDLACRALDRGDVPLALVGGANAVLQADVAVAFSKAGMLSPTGRCRSFDAAADGFVRAEGAAVAVLRPLARAVADGDRVYAVIRATATNQDGRTGGLTVPSGDQQQRMLAGAYRRAGVEPARVGYVEAHGTGTAVGDPVEAAAIGRVLGAGRPADRPLLIGSVKSNLGHLEPASGVVGLVKLALALHHRTVPPNVHFRTPNPRIPFDDLRLRVPTAATPWEAADPADTLYGGVNSFGFGGTNAHAVLASAPPPNGRSAAEHPGPIVWTVSARSAAALETAVRDDAAFLDGVAEDRFASLAAAAARRRTHHPHRVAIVASSPAEAATGLRTGAGPTGHVGAAPPPVAVVFSGQGTQWPGMGRDLLRGDARFRATIEELDAALRPEWGRCLVDEMTRGDESVFRSDVGQPVLFALQVGLYRLVHAWGVRPVAVFGHSIGEVAAAVAAGALGLGDAVRVIVHRSRAQEATRGAGAMAAVGLSAADAAPLLARHAGRVHVAAFNSPTDLTLAGETAAVRAAVDELAGGGTFARLLPFPYAFHSPAMDPCREPFLAAVGALAPRAGDLPFVSTVTGSDLPGDALDAGYWWRNVREPVRFAAATGRAAELGAAVFVEVGPHPGLLRYVQKTAPGAAGVATLRRGADGPRGLAEAAAALHVRGAGSDWAASAGGPAGHADLPRHPWARQQFWAEGEDSVRHRLAGPTHPLLGVREPGPVRQWEACLSAALHPYLADHGFRGRGVVPGAAQIEMLLAAAADGSFADPVGLADVTFDRALWTDPPHVTRTTLDPAARRLAVAARPVGDAGGGWEGVCRGVRWTPGAADPPGAGGAGPPAAATEVSVPAMYARYERAGHHYGPLFRTVRRLWAAGGEVWSEVELDPALHADAGRFYLHPALLDGALQSAIQATPVDEEREAMFLPVRVERIEWRRRAGTAAVCRASNVRVRDARWYADIALFTPAGEPVATLVGCCCVKKPQEATVGRGPTSLYREAWVPAPRVTPAGAPPAACVVVDPTGAAGDLVHRLSASARVWHQTGGGVPADFLKGSGGGAVVVWAAGAAGEPSAAGVLAALAPLLEAGQALAAADAGGFDLWLVTAGATAGHADGVAPNLLQVPAAGMLRTLATELPNVTCRHLDLDPAAAAGHAECVLTELGSPPAEDEIAYRGGERLACQLLPLRPDALGWRPVPAARAAATGYELRTTEPGSLDGLTWVAVEAADPAAHEIEIDVRAVGLNFRDVLKALDLYPLAPTEARSFGDECAGVVRRVGAGVTDFRPGDAVAAVAAHGFGNRVRVPAVLAAGKPANLTFEQAATVPIAFLTADYCLTEVARLEPGESVLIHAAAGGVGQAAVQIARRVGAEVFGTASPEKHAFLRAQGVRHLFHSRNLSFADGVRAATGGRGVDVALNSLAGEFIPRTLELLAPGGRFVEIGKKDIFQNTALDLNAFRAGVSFASVDLSAVIGRRPAWLGRRLRALFDLFARGEYTPVPATRFAADEVADAFRLMAQGKHRGKLVVTPDPDAPPARVLAPDRPVVRPDAAYLITGGLSGLGLRTAEWLTDQGATWLVLAGRTGARSDRARAAVAALAARGVRVEVVACDVTDPAAVRDLVHPAAGGRPPLRGVVHSAMVLRDEPLARVGRAALAAVLGPKVAGAWNLHLATRDVPLDWFVMYSSVATLVGSAGQASYVAANRFLDGLAWARRAEGLPALAVNWGPLADTGVVAGSAALGRYLESVGLGLIEPEVVFQFLKFLLRRDATAVGVARVDWAKLRAASPAAVRSHRLAAVGGAAAAHAGEGSDGLDEVLARPAGERPAALLARLRRGLAAVLLTDEATLDPAAPLTSFGVDSLMAFEFKLRVDREFKTNVPIDRLTAGTSLADLAALLLPQLAAPTRAGPTPTPAPAEPAEPVAQYLCVPTRADADGILEKLTFDAAALLYLPDRLSTVGGLTDAQLPDLFGRQPFVSHLYETPFGRIGVVTLPVRGKELFGSPRVAGLVRSAGELARRRGARVVSLTGLIPSATDYGRAVRDWLGGAGPVVTTGHATTAAAVVLNLEHLLRLGGRGLAGEHLAVLGLGSIGRSCLSLLLDVLPHPRALTLCDVFARRTEAGVIADAAVGAAGFRGPVRVVTSDRGLPEALYEATTILTAVSVPDVLDVGRLRPGTVVVDDSYPPGFDLARGVERAEAAGDILFGNAGMVRLPGPVRETVFLPPGTEAVVDRFGEAAFRRELARDPRELTACILSALLTNRHEGFRPTVGLADPADLRGHYRGLAGLGVTAARAQCGTYFVPDDVIARFRRAFATPRPERA